ncbi:hypothetical protein GQ42DRAFT_164445 [Ramicandelaber brevisporus]|nr:hypothetical protein GQ42DRAFT_164445 [Ramicandelaber brevisporus]
MNTKSPSHSEPEAAAAAAAAAPVAAIPATVAVTSQGTAQGQNSIQVGKDYIQLFMETKWILLELKKYFEQMIPEDARLEFYRQKKTIKRTNQKKNKQKTTTMMSSDSDDDNSKEDAQLRYKDIGADMLWRLTSLKDCKKNIDGLQRVYNSMLGFGKCEAVALPSHKPSSELGIKVQQEVEQILVASHYALGHHVVTQMGLKEDMTPFKNAVAAHLVCFQDYACDLEIQWEDQISAEREAEAASTSTTDSERDDTF